MPTYTLHLAQPLGTSKGDCKISTHWHVYPDGLVLSSVTSTFATPYVWEIQRNRTDFSGRRPWPVGHVSVHLSICFCNSAAKFHEEGSRSCSHTANLFQDCQGFHFNPITIPELAISYRAGLSSILSSAQFGNNAMTNTCTFSRHWQPLRISSCSLAKPRPVAARSFCGPRLQAMVPNSWWRRPQWEHSATDVWPHLYRVAICGLGRAIYTPLWRGENEATIHD